MATRPLRRKRVAAESGIAAVTDPALTRLDVDELAEELLTRTRRVLSADVAGVVLAEESGRGELTVMTMHGPAGSETESMFGSGKGLLASVTVQGEAVLANDTTGAKVAADFADRTMRSFVGCPMVVDGRMLGVVFATAPKSGAFDRDDLNLLQRVADRIAVSLDRTRLAGADRTTRDALAEGQARQRSLVDAAPFGILELDVDGAIERWNRAASELLDWPVFAEGTEAPALPVGVAKKIAALVRATRYGRKRDNAEVRIKRRGAPTVTLDLSGAPVLDAEGHVAGVIVVVANVTEQRQLEQHLRQSQRLDAMATLAGGVAHDFNNLLTVVVGYSQFLLQQLPEDSDIRPDIEAIGKAGARAGELTNQLLTIGRRQVVEPVVFDAQERVADLAAIIERLVGEGIDLRVVTGKGTGLIRVDPYEFEQVVLNLCINSRDAMPKGGRLVVECRGLELDATTAVVPGSYVLVTVADTGTGMSDEVREHCFDPFFTTKGRGKGTGLGLAAVYGVVHQTGGHIDVDSEPGRGTTFRLFFPMSTETVADVPKKKRAPRRSTARPRIGRILLVEDEDAVRHLARAVLEHHGHTVAEYSSAEDALAMARRVKLPFDVLVSDVVMPGMQGDVLAREITELWPKVKVLLVSGYVERAAALRSDRVSFLAKPFALDDLAGRVAELLPPPPRKRAAPKTELKDVGVRGTPRVKLPGFQGSKR